MGYLSVMYIYNTVQNRRQKSRERQHYKGAREKGAREGGGGHQHSNTLALHVHTTQPRSPADRARMDAWARKLPRRHYISIGAPHGVLRLYT